MIHIAARPRSEALRPLVASFHYHESELPSCIERILPSGRAHLMVNLEEDEFRTYSGPNCEIVHRASGAILAGPQGRAAAIDTCEQRRLIAVEFELSGAAPFLSVPLSEVSDQIVELSDVWGRDGYLLRERLCEASTPADKLRALELFLLERMGRPCDPAVTAATKLLNRGAPVAEARSRAGMLPKTFVRRFRHQTGLAPKRFARVRRLQRILGALSEPGAVDWCAIAAEHGYTDQAHLIHDFRELTGMIPSSYCPSSSERRNHVPLGAK